MMTRFTAVCAGLCIAASLSVGAAGETDRKLVVVPTKLFAVEAVSASYTTDSGEKKTQVWKKLDKPLSLPVDGPFEVFVLPKGGIPVRVADKLTVKSGQSHELKIGDLLGSVEVFGDKFPRAAKVVLTDVKDDGPGEKGHIPLQVAKEYRVEMAVPPGTYAVWVVPDNGSKAQRVVENVRVQAGRSTRVGD
jgi:hypothetical protein